MAATTRTRRAVRWTLLAAIVALALLAAVLTNAGGLFAGAAGEEGSATQAGTSRPGASGEADPGEDAGEQREDPGTSDVEVDEPEASDPDAQPLADDERPAVSAVPEDLTPEEAERLLSVYLETVDAVLTAPDRDLARLEDLATDTAASEVRTAAVEYETESLRQEGSARLVSVEVGEIIDAEDRPAVDLVACVDDDDVSLLRDDGTEVLREPRPGLTTHHYRLHHRDDRWVVASHTFPDDATC